MTPRKPTATLTVTVPAAGTSAGPGRNNSLPASVVVTAAGRGHTLESSTPRARQVLLQHRWPAFAPRQATPPSAPEPGGPGALGTTNGGATC